MKRITFLVVLIISTCIAKAGFVLGYQAGMYTPKISNTRATMYYYNKVYNANFKYINLFHGLFIGFRADDKKSWVSFAWNKKQNTFTSNYTTSNNELYRLSIRTKMTELLLDGGIKNKDWGFGIGINMANFDVRTKRAKSSEFSSAEWGREFGAPVRLFGLPDNPSFSFIVEKKIDTGVFLRTCYHFGVAPIDFSLGYQEWLYKVNNITFTLLFNIKMK